jgi:hypothetical protein
MPPGKKTVVSVVTKILGNESRRNFSSTARVIAGLLGNKQHQLRKGTSDIWADRGGFSSTPTASELLRLSKDPVALRSMFDFSLPRLQALKDPVISFEPNPSTSTGHRYTVENKSMPLNQDALRWLSEKPYLMTLLHATAMSRNARVLGLSQAYALLNKPFTLREWQARRWDGPADVVTGLEAYKSVLRARSLSDGDKPRVIIDLDGNMVAPRNSRTIETSRGFASATLMSTLFGSHSLVGGLWWAQHLDLQSGKLDSVFTGAGRSIVPFVDATNIGVALELLSTGHEVAALIANDPEARALFERSGNYDPGLHARVIEIAPPELRARIRTLESAGAMGYLPSVLNRSFNLDFESDVVLESAELQAARDYIGQLDDQQQRLVEEEDEPSITIDDPDVAALPRLARDNDPDRSSDPTDPDEDPGDPPPIDPTIDPDRPSSGPDDPDPNDPTTDPSRDPFDPTRDPGRDPRDPDDPREDPGREHEGTHGREG